MSYILDALKRADAQRERGAVPGLHARQVTAPTLPAAPKAQVRLWLAVAAVLVLGVVAAGLWVWQRPVGAVRLAAVQPAPAQPTVNAPLVQPLPTATAPTVPALQPVPPALPAVVFSSPKPKPEPKPEPKSETVAKAAKPDASAAPAPQAQASATVAAVPLLSELPEEIRRQIPALTITGAVYSDNPAQRMLLVNNQVLTQGSPAAPEVSLEEIRARSSVFSFRGTRFRLAH